MKLDLGCLTLSCNLYCKYMVCMYVCMYVTLQYPCEWHFALHYSRCLVKVLRTPLAPKFRRKQNQQTN